MQAFVLRAYGPPTSLRITDIDVPAPADDEVLVRVRATSVNPYDWHALRGEPRVARLMLGGLDLRRPILEILGCDVAGEVVAIGAAVREFQPGDEVFALIKQGGFAEYVCVPERLLALKPKNLSYAEAAAVPMAGVTALLGVCEAGKIAPGQKVLVNGASGGTGTFAVQIARALGAIVYGVCSTRNLELAQSLGAQDVIDYTVCDFTQHRRRYDLLVDVAGSRSPVACLRAIQPGGTLMLVGGPAGRWIQPVAHMFSALALRPLVSQRVAMVDTVRHGAKKQALQRLTTLIEAGQVRPVIDRCYSFTDIPAAIAYQEMGHAAGKVVIEL
jgi:NADPH:quinone reductase-like Zn-dependent oxidoreductase